MLQQAVERTVEIENERLDLQCMIDLACKPPLPPENRVLVEFLPEARGDDEIDPVALKLLRRGTHKEGFCTLAAPDIGDVLRQDTRNGGNP